MKWKTQSAELMKALSDPRRVQILNLASDQPVTVKHMAEQLDEEPLRLYYHVKKLLKAELLEVVETKQHGNLTEKYYKSINYKDTIYQSNPEDQAENIDLAVSSIRSVIDPALMLYQKSLEKVRAEKGESQTYTHLPYNVSINNITKQMTESEWRASIIELLKAMGIGDEDTNWPDLTSEENKNKPGSYRHVLLSYRIEDAEELGIINEENRD